MAKLNYYKVPKNIDEMTEEEPGLSMESSES
jgi:hypothetical protein